MPVRVRSQCSVVTGTAPRSARRSTRRRRGTGARAAGAAPPRSRAARSRSWRLRSRTPARLLRPWVRRNLSRRYRTVARASCLPQSSGLAADRFRCAALRRCAVVVAATDRSERCAERRPKRSRRQRPRSSRYGAARRARRTSSSSSPGEHGLERQRFAFVVGQRRRRSHRGRRSGAALDAPEGSSISARAVAGARPWSGARSKSPSRSALNSSSTSSGRGSTENSLASGEYDVRSRRHGSRACRRARRASRDP